jgi:hypothetical protein
VPLNFILEHLSASGFGQSFLLQVEVLILRGHSGVSDEHEAPFSKPVRYGSNENIIARYVFENTKALILHLPGGWVEAFSKTVVSKRRRTHASPFALDPRRT